MPSLNCSNRHQKKNNINKNNTSNTFLFCIRHLLNVYLYIEEGDIIEVRNI